VRRNVSVNDNKRTDFVLGRRSQATFARAGFEGLLNLVSHCGVLGGLLLLLAEGDRAAGLYLAEQGRSRKHRGNRVLDLPCCLSGLRSIFCKNQQVAAGQDATRIRIRIRSIHWNNTR
jgi:hypothetical protein